ncbi:MAG: hypothetical protein ABI614_26430, partial [Planctomycetota bacterium]
NRELDPSEIAESAEGTGQLLAGAAELPGPTGAGWVFELSGHHFFNKSRQMGGLNFVRNTFLKTLEEGSIDLPINAKGDLGTFTMKELGISHPILFSDEGEPQSIRVPNPDVQVAASGSSAGGEGSGAGGPGSGGQMTTTPGPGGPGVKKDDPDAQPAFFEVKQTTFTIQFCWTPKPLSERLAAQKEAAELKAAADAETAANAPPPPAAVDEAGTDQGAPAGAAEPEPVDPAAAPVGANEAGA